MLRKHPQQVAWLTVLTGLLAFCLSCSAFGYGVYYFLFQSTVPLTMKMVVSRGAVKLTTLDSTNPLVDNQITIEPQTYLDVRDDSQAVLFIQDSYSLRTITTMTLTTGTKLFVAEATRPRFDFSRRPYRIDMSRASGQLIITSTPEGREFQMDIRSDLGMARLMDDGRYTVNTEYYPETKLQRLNLFNQGGRANLYKPSLSEWKEVNPNRIAHLVFKNNANAPEFEPESDSPLIILAEGRFLTDVAPSTTAELPANWGCTNGVERDAVLPDEVPGAFFRDAAEGNALHFMREGDSLIKHGETSCFWPNKGGGIDLTPYATVRIHLRLQLRDHDLPLCGIVGSECPIMVEIRYQYPSPDGKTEMPIQQWNHGFYLIPDPSKPATCGTCSLAHERVNPNVWYFYDSGDLRTQLVDNATGAVPTILKLSIYASGHQWDALVSDVTLLGTLK
jgi:hypothetical protein